MASRLRKWYIKDMTEKPIGERVELRIKDGHKNRMRDHVYTCVWSHFESCPWGIAYVRVTERVDERSNRLMTQIRDHVLERMSHG